MDLLTPQQELFALGCATLSQAAAYRAAYDCSGSNFKTIAANASHLAALPHVAARIQHFRDEAAQRTAIPALEVRIKELRELETADPTEIIGLHWGSCRHCHGVDHAYQWSDDMEYAQACDLAVKCKQALPDMAGGFGYNPTLEPAPDCTRCWGVGVQRPYVVDTRKLSPKAKRLYKGIKIKGNGDIEVLLHDQQKATDMLNRIQGAYKDGAGVPVAAPAAEVIAAAEAKTTEERQRSYLRVVSG